MALIKCPECGKKVSEKANACIHCGYPINNVEKEKNYEDIIKYSPLELTRRELVEDSYKKNGWIPFLW